MTVMVTVTNVDEDGVVSTGTARQPKAGTRITAMLTDDDNDTPTIVTWQWATSTSDAGPWNNIEPTATLDDDDDGNDPAYTPRESDAGYYLQATVTYEDGITEDDTTTPDVDESIDTASKAFTLPVLMEDYENTAPVFPDQDPNMEGRQTDQEMRVPENAEVDDTVGDPVVAIDKDATGSQESLFYTLEDDTTAGTGDDRDSGDDTSFFKINSTTGQISVKKKGLNYESPTDDDKTYNVIVMATDPSSDNSTVKVAIEVIDVREAPKMGDEDANANRTSTTIPETTATTVSLSNYTASDDDDGTTPALTWTLSGSDDDMFMLCAGDSGGTCVAVDDNTVQLRLEEELDYEARTDKVYDVTVTATDSHDMSVSRDVAVTVTNAEEDGVVTLSGQQPEVGSAGGRGITATLTDPDGSLRDITWTWATSTSDNVNGTWSDVQTTTGRTSSTYKSKVGDVDDYLRVTVTYKDGHGEAEDGPLQEVPTNMVKAADTLNSSPEFEDSTPEWVVSEDADITSASTDITITDDADANVCDTLAYELTGTDHEIFTHTEGATTSPDANDVCTYTVTISFVSGTELDYDTDNSYTVKLSAKDPSNASASATLTVKLDDVDEVPYFISEERSFNHPENDAGTVTTFVVKDPEGKNVTWILGGTDEDDFNDIAGTCNSRTKECSGVLTFKEDSQPDYETEDSYLITVQASDGRQTVGFSSVETVTITIDDVDEDGVVSTGTTRQPKVGTRITAMLTDDDNDTPTIVTWQWATSTSATGPWNDIEPTGEDTDIDDGNDPAYTPRESDVGYYLQATVTYIDDTTPDDTTTPDVDERVDTASKAFTLPVLMEDYENTAPVFPDQDPNMEGRQTDQEMRVPENAEVDDTVGDPVAAIDKDATGSQESLFYSLEDDTTVGTGDDRDATPGNDDLSFFKINSTTGQISVKKKGLNYESPTDDDKTYNLIVRATDPSSDNSTTKVAIEVIDLREAPEMVDEIGSDQVQNLSATTTVEHDSDSNGTATTTVLSTYAATDDEDDNATPAVMREWSLEGVDKDMFALCEEDDDSTNTCSDPDTTGGNNIVTLRFKENPNFEARADSAGNNVYNITVVATDNDGQTASRNVAVTLTNVEEDGEVTLSNRQPEVGIPITASLTDPDGGIPSTTWQWYRAVDASSDACDPWMPNDDVEEIPNAMSRTYTPVATDADTGNTGRCLYPVATYTDNHRPLDQPGSTEDESQEKDMATGTSAFVVQRMDSNNQVPVFPNQNAAMTIRISESTAEGDPLGGTTPVPVQAQDDDDNLTYTLGGADAGFFTIDTTDDGGQIRVGKGTKLDYDQGRRSYTVTVTATDPSLASATITVTIEVVNENEAPEVSTKGLAVSGVASVSYAEDRDDAVETYTARGDEAAGVSWSLAGDDSSAFSIAGGVLSFRASPNFESPTDDGTDNVYNVTVRATGATISASRDVTVTVTNVDEDGTATITPSGQPRVGVELTASLTDIDGTPTAVSWQWSRSTSNTGGWSNIAGGRQANYTPTVADEDNYLRATASYTDPQGSGKSESAVTSAAVLAASTEGTPGTVALTPSTQLTSGDSVTATLTDADNPVNQAWLWQRSVDGGSTNWTTISTATSASYTTVNADGGNYLRASVTYTDDSGANQTAGPTATANRVRIDSYDANADGRIDGPEVLRAVADYFRGDILGPRVLQVVALYFAGLS